MQFWSEILLLISNQTRATCSFDFEITRMISDQIALHLVQLPLYIHPNNYITNPAVTVVFLIQTSASSNNFFDRFLFYSYLFIYLFALYLLVVFTSHIVTQVKK